MRRALQQGPQHLPVTINQTPEGILISHMYTNIVDQAFGSRVEEGHRHQGAQQPHGAVGQASERKIAASGQLLCVEAYVLVPQPPQQPAENNP